MDVSQALYRRHSTRAFLDRPVPRADIERMLTDAGRAPSGTNTQPWHVAVVSGRTKRTIEGRIEAAFRAGHRSRPDYKYYPTTWVEPYKSRRFACGMQLYGALGIRRQDSERRLAQWVLNYRSFGAPVTLFFYMPSPMEAGSYMDFGMFLQSVMLMAVQQGLATCPQASLAEYPDIVKQELGLAADTVLLCGMALGYEDTGAAVNGYRTPREPLEGYVTFHLD